MSTLYIMRSRFQPFTKYHFDAINSLVKSKSDDFEKGVAHLLLCVIRDYETLFRLHKPEKQLQVDPVDFRHLPMFNPLSTSEIIFDIRDGIREFYDGVDAVADKQLCEQLLSKWLIISPVHAKFKDLGEILVRPEQIPEGYREFLFEGCQKSNDCIVPVLNWGVLDALDSVLPRGRWQRTWVLPMLDAEDYDDLASAWKFIPSMPSPKDNVIAGVYSANTHGLRIHRWNPTRIGIYGVFACDAFCRLQDCRRHMEAACHIDELCDVNEMQAMSNIIDAVVPRRVRKRYEIQLTKRITDVGRELQHPKNRFYERPYYTGAKGFADMCVSQFAYLDSETVATIQQECTAKKTPVIVIGMPRDLRQRYEQCRKTIFEGCDLKGWRRNQDLSAVADELVSLTTLVGLLSKHTTIPRGCTESDIAILEGLAGVNTVEQLSVFLKKHNITAFSEIVKHIDDN